MPDTSREVTRHVLDNGLIVLLKEVHTAPVISWWVLYRVGSRNERTGQTGVSHWVEHMLFKGTEQFPAGVLDKAVDREGGVWNAQTSYDYTAYFETMPAGRIDLALPDDDALGELHERLRHHGFQTRDDGRTLSFDDPWKNALHATVG